MASVKLEGETTLIVTEDDVRAILTDHFCGSSYDAFTNLQVEVASQNQEGDFVLTLTPKPQSEEQK